MRLDLRFCRGMGVSHRTRFGLRAFTVLSALALAGCAEVHLYSPSLDKASATAADALPSEAAALKPFDDQLATLDAFGQREDLVVARYWTDVRDAHFVRLIAMDRRVDRPGRITAQVDRRLSDVLGASGTLPAQDPVQLAARKVEMEALAASQRREYIRSYRRLEASKSPDDLALVAAADVERSGQPKPTDAALQGDLACPAMIARFSVANADELVASGKALRAPVGQIAILCRRADDLDRQLRAFRLPDGELGAAQQAAVAATVRTGSELGDRARSLQQQIDAAVKFADTDSDGAQLRHLADSLKSILDTADAGAKLVGWSSASDTIEDILKARLCTSDTVDDAAKKEAKCGEVVPNSTTGRIAASWGLAKALAQVSDANASARRSTLWLLAAKAIIAAQKTDAELGLQEAKAVAFAEQRRALALQREAALLLLARRSASGPRGDCHGGARGGDKGPNASCQLAAYVDSWNEGRIPAEILKYRSVQISRSFAVRRARAVALKEHVLASSGVGTLRLYGADGIKAALIAQALFDAGILGVGIGDL